MKSNKYCPRILVIILLVLSPIGLSSCPQYYIDTEIKVINESSYNLHIIFERIFPYGGFDESINVNQSESVSFGIFPLRGGKQNDHYNPNELAINIIIFNFVTGEIIREMDNMDKGIMFFEFIGFNDFSALYQFKITDDLLFPWLDIL